ncbi:uncharacterized protein MELLADRAFT_91280 [Melampsora larici-populina 98AG31]|uniref:Uncharacterized protein n=1 Tax=Melampsora larici-populina (strain 98AG31 / pathotype 3-4-7) TaxID=747676 RepID=F4RYG8_MELLP|nr:uncharacterized protein MELLADRAFT_91280 [Melampsora larici-populina 98AG31]EGG02579.1 hypothetical protein MELLADRAFT_91280 [Melampsora larici-populina 98AG31]
MSPVDGQIHPENNSWDGLNIPNGVQPGLRETNEAVEVEGEVEIVTEEDIAIDVHVNNRGHSNGTRSDTYHSRPFVPWNQNFTSYPQTHNPAPIYYGSNQYNTNHQSNNLQTSSDVKLSMTFSLEATLLMVESRSWYLNDVFNEKQVQSSIVPNYAFTHQEFAVTLQNEAYRRYNSYASHVKLQKDVIRSNPTRFEIGPAYTAQPKDR